MTIQGRSTIVGVFENRPRAEAAIRDLQSAGFRDDQIGFVVRNDETAEGVHETVEEHGTEAGSGAAAGAVSGGILGGLIGAAAALLIPGFGPAIAGGILAATLGGIAIGAATGGLFGALIGLGVPEEEARYYEGEFQSGRTLVTVKADGRQQEAYDILHRNGGYDVSTRPAEAQTVQTSTSTTSSTLTPNLYQAGGTVNPSAYDQNTRSDRMEGPGAATSAGAYDPNMRSEQMSSTGATANAGTYDANMRSDYGTGTSSAVNAGTYNPNMRQSQMSQTNESNPGAYDPNMQTNQVGQTNDDVNTGAYYPNVQSEQASQPNAGINTGLSNPNMRPDKTEPVGSSTSSRQYDPVKGPVQGQTAPVDSSGYGMQRDPSVETDATAGTYDTNERSGTTMERESENTFFGSPDAPSIAPGSHDDPNLRSPRVP